MDKIHEELTTTLTRSEWRGYYFDLLESLALLGNVENDLEILVDTLGQLTELPDATYANLVAIVKRLKRDILSATGGLETLDQTMPSAKDLNK
jgi:hypothetical protein